VPLSDPRDEIAAAADIISSGGEDFAAFATSRWPALVRLAYGLTGDRRAAEDIAQTTMARACLAWRRVSRSADQDTYLRRILINTSSRRFRKRRVAGQPGDPPDRATDSPADLAGDREVLTVALRELPAGQRAVVVLRYWEDLTDSQIAAILGCSASTVRDRLSGALTRLQVAAEDGEDR
jgi:RNA polymerase sigma-70 factor (sigma-E family)